VMLAQTELLNDVQRAAVEHTDGPVLIFAGAGSGKTRVLTHRIAHLLEEKNVFPDRILAVTFTNKAAGEMKARLERMVGAPARDLWVGTFHAMCVRMLRRDGRKIGISPNFAIMDDADQRAIVRDVIADLDYDERQIAPGAALAGRGFPVVIVDPRTEIAEGIPVVCAAHSSGATQATRHLLELGHRRIAVIGGPRGWVATEERMRGHHAALAGAGVLGLSRVGRYIAAVFGRRTVPLD